MSTQATPKPNTTMQSPKVPQTATTPVHNAATAEKARSGRKLVDPNETPEKTFKRLCEPRITKLLKQCLMVRRLNRFKPTEAQREKVFKAIREAVNIAETAWKGTEQLEDGFQL